MGTVHYRTGDTWQVMSYMEGLQTGLHGEKYMVEVIWYCTVTDWGYMAGYECSLQSCGRVIEKLAW